MVASTASQVRAAQNQINLFETPLKMFYLDLNAYPTTNQGLDALWEQPSDLAMPDRWSGPYLEKAVPLDPWGKPYRYHSPGVLNPESYDLWSTGPDGVHDIGNWQQLRRSG